MWRRLRRSGVATAMALLGLTTVAGMIEAANTPAEQRLLERIRVLEERLNKLEKIEGPAKPPPAAETADMERLLERLEALEERLDRLDRTTVIKKQVEYVCPGGEILTEPPPEGRCPDTSRPQVRETVRTESVLRRQSIAEQVEGALQDAEGKKVAIGGSARGILQQVANADKGQNDLFPSGAFDLTLLSQPMANTWFFVDIEAVAGPGPDRVLGTLSRLNADVETLGLGGLGVGGQDQRLAIREAWLGFRLLKDRLDLYAGKLDPTNYFDRNAFANDETSQFLAGSLVNNTMLKQPPNGPGLVTRWDAVRDLGFSLGVVGSREFEESMFEGPFVIGEIDYHSTRLLDGNYRLWARLGRVPDDLQRQTWGMGVSLDQLLTEQLGLFVRAGFSQSDGVGQISSAASGGLQYRAPWLSRPRDRVGAGYSYQWEPIGAEQVAEFYYNFFLTDRLSMIANLQWLITGPNQVNDRWNNNVIIPGLRAVVGF
jgi:Carbohydrate-selective porin, OprB family